MIAQDSPMMLEKAAEFLIEEMTLRAWYDTNLEGRCTIQMEDVANALARSDVFDFLIDIIPRGSVPVTGALAEADPP